MIRKYDVQSYLQCEKWCSIYTEKIQDKRSDFTKRLTKRNEAH